MAGQLEFELRDAPRRIALNVTQLVRMVRETLEVNLDEYWVSGEVSNLRRAASNHLYFTLKDSRSAINVVMFSTSGRRLRFRPADGMQIIVRGRVNLYEARGTLQLYAEEIEPRGLGALQLAFDQLKQRLQTEGLFDAVRKRPLPKLPQIIGIVTATGGAALRDLMRVTLDRYPNLHLIIRPSPVQGPTAAAAIVAAIEDLNRDARAQVIIVGRGGGSLEDLWPFNEEKVARAIRASAIPVVSAVGHEIDYTIADFAADLRAPTPSAAAQMVVPIKAEVRRQLDRLAAAMLSTTRAALGGHRRHLLQLRGRLRDPKSLLRQLRQRLDDIALVMRKRLAAQAAMRRESMRELESRMRYPAALRALVAAQRRRVVLLGDRLGAVMRRTLERSRFRLGAQAQHLDAVSPLRVLDRGYAVVTNLRDGHAVADARQVEVGDELSIRVAHGRIGARATRRDS
jgi:exodeoxyribonuclease VII large subunit